MATVDLEQLATALRDEGRMVVSLKRGSEDVEWVSCGGVVVYPSGRIELQPMGVIPADVTAVVYHVGKLWRAVSPSAPEGVREQAIKIVEEEASSFDWLGTGTASRAAQARECRAWSEGIVDAVLAVLPPAPRVDVDAVMKLVETYGKLKRKQCDFASSGRPDLAYRAYDDSLETFAAIRAMLEGTA